MDEDQAKAGSKNKISNVNLIKVHREKRQDLRCLFPIFYFQVTNCTFVIVSIR